MSNIFLSLMGIYYSLMGIIFAYCLFVVQIWLQACSEYSARSAELVSSTSIGDLERYKAKERGNRQMSLFPWFQIWLILGLTFGLMSLVLAASQKVTEVGFIFDGLPAVALFVLTLGASYFSWRLGLARIHYAQSTLS